VQDTNEINIKAHLAIIEFNIQKREHDPQRTVREIIWRLSWPARNHSATGLRSFFFRLLKRLNKATVLNCVDLVFSPLNCSKPKADEIHRRVSRLMFLKNTVFALHQAKRWTQY